MCHTDAIETQHQCCMGLKFCGSNKIEVLAI